MYNTGNYLARWKKEGVLNNELEALIIIVDWFTTVAPDISSDLVWCLYLQWDRYQQHSEAVNHELALYWLQ